jgi:hypothetical protein
LVSILNSEKATYSVLLKQEVDMIVELGGSQKYPKDEPSDFEKQTKKFMTLLTPAEWAISDSEMETLLKSK